MCRLWVLLFLQIVAAGHLESGPVDQPPWVVRWVNFPRRTGVSIDAVGDGPQPLQPLLQSSLFHVTPDAVPAQPLPYIGAMVHRIFFSDSAEHQHPARIFFSDSAEHQHPAETRQALIDLSTGFEFVEGQSYTVSIQRKWWGDTPPVPYRFTAPYNSSAGTSRNQPQSVHTCSSSRMSLITQAINSAKDYQKWAHQGYTATSKCHAGAGETWFGTYDASTYAHVARTMKNIHELLESGDFTPSCSPIDPYLGSPYSTDPVCKVSYSSVVLAYVYWSKTASKVVHLCPAHFDETTNVGFSEGGLSSYTQAGTILHELSHFLDIGATQDYAYGYQDCHDLASGTLPYHYASQAAYNADNYNYFVKANPGSGRKCSLLEGSCCGCGAVFLPQTTTCRSPQWTCDPVETCTGNVATCPVDILDSCSYSWDSDPFGVCQSACIQTRRVACVRSADGVSTSMHSKCTGLAPPSIQPCPVCNSNPSPTAPTAAWVASPWSTCSEACTQERQVVCRLTQSGAVTTDDQCDKDSKPAATAPCEGGACARAWSIGTWSNCNHVTCSSSRWVTCGSTTPSVSGDPSAPTSSLCTRRRPIVSRPCAVAGSSKCDGASGVGARVVLKLSWPVPVTTAVVDALRSAAAALTPPVTLDRIRVATSASSDDTITLEILPTMSQVEEAAADIAHRLEAAVRDEQLFTSAQSQPPDMVFLTPSVERGNMCLSGSGTWTFDCNKSAGLSRGAIAGIVLGSVAVALIAALVIHKCFCNKRKAAETEHVRLAEAEDGDFELEEAGAGQQADAHPESAAAAADAAGDDEVAAHEVVISTEADDHKSNE